MSNDGQLPFGHPWVKVLWRQGMMIMLQLEANSWLRLSWHVKRDSIQWDVGEEEV
jgi:hypothetical protein